MKPPVKLSLSGQDTIDKAAEAILQERTEVQIALPADYHHALFKQMCPGALPAEPEVLDLRGGSEVLESVAAVAGLQLFEALLRPVSHAGYAVALQSPNPVITLSPTGTLPAEAPRFP